jgi:carotenoid cleavage dioxygenase
MKGARMAVDVTAHPTLQGVFAPIADEHDLVDLEVSGALPPVLRGMYARNGSNPAFTPLGNYHLFDGDGMIHALYLEDGGARYRNRWVESKGLLAERARGRACFGGLGEYRLPDPDVLAEVGPMKNTANTNIVAHAGRWLALMEAAVPTEVTRELETVGEYDFGGRLAGPMTAHPKHDPATGELLFFGYSPFPPYLRYHVARADGTLARSVELDRPAPVMMHDFVCTDRSAVFFDLPALFDLEEMLRGGPGIRWEPDNGARIGVLPRAGDGGVQWIEIEPCYVFHFLNAWEHDGVVFVDGFHADRMPTAFGTDTLEEPVLPTLRRWTIDVAAGVTKCEPLDDRPAEFPRLNEQFAGRRNRYGYAGRARAWTLDEVEWTGVVKYDLDRDSSITHEYAPGEFGGEAVFVPDPDGRAEDDGWLLTFVTAKSTDRSHLLVLDARDLDEVARVHIPVRIPAGFHGNWFASDTASTAAARAGTSEASAGGP